MATTSAKRATDDRTKRQAAGGSASAGRPEETSGWDSIFDDEPEYSQAVEPRTTQQGSASSPLDKDYFGDELPPPPRAGFAVTFPVRSKPSRDDSDAERGAMVGWWYMVLAAVPSFLAFLYFSTLGVPPKPLLLPMVVYGGLMLVAGTIMLVISPLWFIGLVFKESVLNGVLIFFIPLFDIYLTMTRWRILRGPFLLRAYVFCGWAVALVFFGSYTIVFGKRNPPNAAANDRPPVVARGAEAPNALTKPDADGGDGQRDERPGAELQRRQDRIGRPNGFDAVEFDRRPLATIDGNNFDRDDMVERSLKQLGSPDRAKWKEATERLERTTPDHRVDQVSNAILPLLDNDDGFLVAASIKALAAWRITSAVPTIVGRTSDNRFNVRWEAIKALGRMKDSRGVDSLVARLREDGMQAEAALQQIGPAAERAVIELLRSPYADLRRKACNILKQVGGTETLKAMQSIPVDPDFGVRMAANEASNQIQARVGPVPKGSGAPSPLMVPTRQRGTP